MTVDLWLVFASLLFFSVGWGLYFFSWPLFVQSLGATAVNLGYLTALSSFIATLSVIPGGYLADRYERRWQLILSWAMCIPVPLLFLVARDWRGLVPGVVLFALAIFSSPALTAYAAAKARPGKVSSALSVVYAGLSFGFIAGPMLAVPLNAAWGMRGVFWVATLLYTASTVVLFWVSPDHPVGKVHRATGSARPRFQLPSPALWRVCLLFAGVAAAIQVTSPFVAPFARDVLHHGVNWVNTAGAVTGVGGTLLAIFFGRYADRVGPRRGLALGLGLYALAMAGLVAVGQWPAVWLMLALRGAGDGIKSLMSSTIAHETSPERLGRSLGFYSVMANVGYTIGPVVGGYVYALNPAGPFWLATGMAVLLGVYTLISAGRGRTTGCARRAGGL